MAKRDLKDVVERFDRKVGREVAGKDDVARILCLQLRSMVKASVSRPKPNEPIHRYFNFLSTCRFLEKLGFSLWFGKMAGTWNLNVFDKMNGGLSSVPRQ